MCKQHQKYKPVFESTSAAMDFNCKALSLKASSLKGMESELRHRFIVAFISIHVSCCHGYDPITNTFYELVTWIAVGVCVCV